MRIKKEKTLAVIIDVQERLFPVMAEKEKLAKNLEILIKGLNVLGVKMMVTQQYTKALGETLPDIAQAIGTFKPIEKIAFSCCDEPVFFEDLQQDPKKHIIIAGIEAHVCVQQTVIDLLSCGHKPVVIEDCVSSRDMNNKRIAIERMRQAGAIITSYESILFELCQFAGNQQFKEISKLIK